MKLTRARKSINLIFMKSASAIQSQVTFGNKLRALRRAKGVPTACALARMAGLGLSHVGMFERGDLLPAWRTAVKLADALRLGEIERREFYEMLDAARKPSEVQELLGNGVARATGT